MTNTKDLPIETGGWVSGKSAYVCRKCPAKSTSGKESGSKYGNQNKSLWKIVTIGICWTILS
jgi:positive regulator of sigma E activity